MVVGRSLGLNGLLDFIGGLLRLQFDVTEQLLQRRTIRGVQSSDFVFFFLG